MLFIHRVFLAKYLCFALVMAKEKWKLQLMLLHRSLEVHRMSKLTNRRQWADNYLLTGELPNFRQGMHANILQSLLMKMSKKSSGHTLDNFVKMIDVQENFETITIPKYLQ